MKHFNSSDNIIVETFNKLDNEGKKIISTASLALNRMIYFPFFVSAVECPNYLYRAVKHNPLTKKDIQYPPVKYAKLNRCSLDSQPIFYAANTGEGALLECSDCYNGQKTEPEILFISRWKIIRPFYLVDFYYKDIYQGINQKLYEHIIKTDRKIYIESKNPEQDKKMLTTCGNRFTVNGDIAYPFTALLSNLIYGQVIRKEIIQGITYVGVKEDTYSNIAILPELINDKSVILTDVIKVKVIGKIDVEILAATDKSKEILDQIVLNDKKKLGEFRLSQIQDEFKWKFTES